MLFDLRSGKRKRVIQVTYGILAFLMAASLFTVVGPLRLGDIFGGGSSGSATAQYDTEISAAQQKLQKDPKNQKALLDLSRAYSLRGKVELSSSCVTQLASGSARSDFVQAANAWEGYLKLVHGPPDSGVAGYMVQSYICLGDYTGGARAAQVIAQKQPSLNSYGTLALLEYAAGDISAADAAAAKAVKAAPASERKGFKSQFAQARKQALKQQQLAKKTSQGAPGQVNPLLNPTGSLGGTGVAPPPGG